MARRKARKAKPYKYVGPKVQAMLLGDGTKIISPEKLEGERLETLLERHPQLRNYYAILDEEE